MKIREAQLIPIVISVAFFAFLFAAGCSDDPADPDPDTPTPVAATIEGTLSRTTGVGTGQQVADQIDFWVAESVVGEIVAMRLAGQTDDTAEPADPDGVDFRIQPELDVSLFAPGEAVTLGFLRGSGTVYTSVVFEGPTVDLLIIAPTSATTVSTQGFTVQWSGLGAGSVTIRIASSVRQQTWETTTENDGFYEVQADDLVGFPRGECVIDVEKITEAALASPILGGGVVTFVMSGSVTVSLGV